MIYVYCGRASKSAVRLTTYLKENGPGAKKTTEFTMEPGDLAINWGVPLGFSVRGLWLNARFVGDKRLDLAKMRHAGLPVPQVSTRASAGFFGRASMHHDGNDLDEGGYDYYVEKVATIGECRVNSFKGVSIGAGLKVPRRNFPGEIDPVFRTYKRGWDFSYTDDARRQIPDGARSLAHKAVKAVGLDFGAVDIGFTPGGGLVVFEVNSAPGIEGWEVEAYGDAILEYLQTATNR